MSVFGGDMFLFEAQSNSRSSQTGRAHLLLVSDFPGEPRGALGVVTLEGE